MRTLLKQGSDVNAAQGDGMTALHWAAQRGDAELTLSAKELALLETFMRRPGEVLDRFELLEHAWDYDYENRSNVVDVYVGYLRSKLEQDGAPRLLQTVRGAGYVLREPR